MKLTRKASSPDTDDYRFRAQLSALGYPAFAHVVPVRPKPVPDSVLFSALASPDADARVVEALPWLVRRYAGQLGMDWLVRQAKLHNLQNRLGFVLQVAGIETPDHAAAVQELERARLLLEATLCWDSMPAATRGWIRINRSPVAAHWNVLTTLQAGGAGDAG